MSKRGNRYLRRALMLAAERAVRHDPQPAAVLAAQALPRHRPLSAPQRVACCGAAPRPRG